jgi:hypothetical protein
VTVTEKHQEVDGSELAFAPLWTSFGFHDQLALSFGIAWRFPVSAVFPAFPRTAHGS